MLASAPMVMDDIPPHEPAVKIGILTALPKECAAVRLLLTEEVERTAPGKGGGRRYYLGRVPAKAGGSHLVAVGLLPDMGNNSAAISASRLLDHFPSVEHIIMCGIAGGVPKPGDPEHDVRLGDIVVSDRNGVVQYDLIKERPDGTKEHRHPPRPPDAELLEAVRHLMTEEELGRRPWERFLRIDASKAKWQRPSDNMDARGQEVTLPRDPERTVGQPRVFHATIAAANVLLKNPAQRDDLGERFGVKAVEMESSGVADATWMSRAGYLVVRGICDYCDGRKGDAWQRAAAFAAAAYVRALLEALPGAPSSGEPERAEPVSDAELTSYLRKIESLHRELRVAGFETRVRVKIELHDLYVPLDAMVDQRTSPEQVFHFEDAAAAAKHHGAHPDRHQVKLAEAFEQAHAQGHHGVVLLGDPGSGKTTHLKQVLLKVIRDGPESIGLPPGTVPVFLALRNLHDHTTKFSRFIEQELGDPLLESPDDFGTRMCQRGRLLFLLDGLDEVVNADERAKVAGWIDHARRADPSNRFLVSCRFAGYGDAVRLTEGFLELHLRPMSKKQARAFVRNWYRVVERAGGGDEEQIALRAEQGAKALIEVLEDRALASVSRVYQMTHNPLLLTAICLVHRDRGALPDKRWLLYHEAVQVLLERWRKFTNKLPVTFPAEQARKVLQPVALWMHQEQGRTRAHTSDLEQPVGQALRAAGLGEVTAAKFLRIIRDESGLLTGWGVDSFGFMHLGFQEYLAARAIRSRAFDEPELLEALAGRFEDSWWQEVILLMLAQDDPPLFDRFMAAVLRRSEAAEWTRSEMMQRCLVEAENRSPRPFVELVRGDGGSWLRRAWRKVSGGGRVELRGRQVAALDVLGRAMPEPLAELAGVLERHPAAEVRAWWERWQRRGRVGTERKVDPKSGVELVWIPGGRFLMGSPEDDDLAWEVEKPAHEVELDGFWLGKTVVTNAQYGEYMRAKRGVREPAYWGDPSLNQPQQPMVGVSWEEAVGYCKWAGLSLPTEAQWEYACRAGTTTRYHSGDSEKDLARVGWYEGNSGGRLHAVGELEPNGFGLYDMHGNVDEWCEDQWGSYEGAVHQPGDGLRTQPVGGANRVVRGGDFFYVPRGARSAYRHRYEPGSRFINVGFRVAQGHS